MATRLRGKLKRAVPKTRFFLQRLNLAEALERRRYCKTHGLGLPVPPRRLRALVGPDLLIERFLEQGKRTTSEIRDTLEAVGRRLEQFPNILDFGCGCGRQLRWLGDLPPSCHLHGSDICADAIRWNRRHLRFAQFACNAFDPPLPYDAETFDLIFALSVFTHLGEQSQLAWLEELKRVAAPGAILLITTQGDLGFEKFRGGTLPASADLIERLRRHTDLTEKGMVFESYEPGGKYGLAFHDVAYIRKYWEQGLRILKFIPHGGDGWQDVVVLEKVDRQNDSSPDMRDSEHSIEAGFGPITTHRSKSRRQDVIQIDGLKKQFGDNVVLDGVDLTIEPGETRVVIGRSGEGKSVLLKHIIALTRPDAGTIDVDGHRLNWHKRESLDHVRTIVGMLFQGAALFDSMNVHDNIAFALVEQGRLSAAEIDRIVAEKLELVNLSGVGDLMPAELSGGMKKRVGLARALAPDPRIMLYDEPTTGLDPINADAINELIRDMQRKLGVTSVVVTHDMTNAYKVGDLISMLHQGRIIETGTPDEIRNTTDPTVRQFVLGLADGPITAEPLAIG